MTLPTQLFVDGAWRPAGSGNRSTLVNPATEQPFTQVAAADVADVNSAVASAHRAWETGLATRASATANDGWRDLAPGKRTEILFNIARRLREHLEEIAQLETL